VGTQKTGSTPLYEGRSPPFGPVRFGRSKVSHGLAVIFLARLERPFLARILRLAGVQDQKFLFLHNPLRHLARPNSTKYKFNMSPEMLVCFILYLT
jgi:hypothetical protein